MSERLLGAVLMAVSASAFGSMAIFGVWAHDDGIETSMVLFFRFAVAAVILLVIVYARGIELGALKRYGVVAAMGAIGYVGQAYCYFLALQHADASLVALLLYLYPAFVAILAAVFLKERIGPVTAIALLLALIGTAFVVGGGSGALIGIALAIGGAVIYSIYITVGAVATKGIDSLLVATVVCCSAAVVCGAILLIKVVAGTAEPMPASARGWISLSAIAVICTVVAIVTFFAGLQRLGPTSAAVMSTLEPVVTVALAMWLLGEALSRLQLLGGALVLVAVVSLALAQRPVKVEAATPV